MGTAFLKNQRATITTYTWDKYSIDQWAESDGTTHYINAYHNAGWSYGATYTFDKSTGLYSLSGTTYLITSYTPSAVYASGSGNYITDWSSVFAQSLHYDSTEIGYTVVYVKDKTKVATTHTQGNINYGTVTSTNYSEYPANGEKNGYWYVRRA